MNTVIDEPVLIEGSIGYIVSWNDDNKAWTGVVADFDEGTVLDIGCEATPLEAENFCKTSINIKPWIEGNPVVEDMIDRAAT